MIIVDYKGMDYKGQRMEGTHKVSCGIGRKDAPAIERDVLKRNTTLRHVEILCVKEK